MSTRKKNTTVRPAPATPDPAPDTAAVAPDWGSVAAGVPVLRTDSDAALWAVLGAFPGFTTAELAGAAGIGVSTARRVLSSWETAGAARSHSNPESPRAAKTWTPAESDAEPEPVASEPADCEPAAPAEMDTTHAGCVPNDPVPSDFRQAVTVVAGTTSDGDADPAPPTPDGADDAAAAQPESAQRLRSGALRGQVEDFLRDHPGEDFSPHQIGKALDRSSGAVHNALVTLTKGRAARQTSTAPKRFALVSN